MAVVPLSQPRLIPFPSCPQDGLADPEGCIVNVVGLAAALMVPWTAACDGTGSANDTACQCAVMVLNSYLLRGQTIRRSRAAGSDASATRTDAERQPDDPRMQVVLEPSEQERENPATIRGREAV